MKAGCGTDFRGLTLGLLTPLGHPSSPRLVCFDFLVTSGNRVTLILAVCTDERHLECPQRRTLVACVAHCLAMIASLEEWLGACDGLVPLFVASRANHVRGRHGEWLWGAILTRQMS